MDDARTACSFLIPGYHILRDEVVGAEVEVNGMFGIADQQDIAWADPEKHIVYHLHSEDVSGEELLRSPKVSRHRINADYTIKKLPMQYALGVSCINNIFCRKRSVPYSIP